jgi:uncharacterized membrane protein YvbJ
MPLISCEACGNEISDQASSCPRCGHPVLGLRVNPPVPVMLRSHSFLAKAAKRTAWVLACGVACIVILLLAGSVLTKSSGESASRQPAGSAIFQVSDTLADEGCTQLGDYCIRVHCTYVNNGQAAGEKLVAAELDDGQEVVATRRSNLTLLPAGSQRVDFDFPEAELAGEHHYRYSCSVKDSR